MCRLRIKERETASASYEINSGLSIFMPDGIPDLAFNDYTTENELRASIKLLMQ